MICWAHDLGNCSTKISKEHIISEALFAGRMIRVEGFPWCMDEPIEINIASLTKKCLCVTHNNKLSCLDAEGSRYFDAMKEFIQTLNKRFGTPYTSWNIIVRHIKGNLIERWFLKTLINMCYNNSELPIGHDSKTPGAPSQHLAEIAFGAKKFETGAGLYFSAPVGKPISYNDSIEFSPLIKDKKYISGGLFIFRGAHIILHLGPDHLPAPLSGVFLGGFDLGTTSVNYHLENFNAADGNILSHSIQIHWD